jgi:hypothetical protein
MLQTRRRALATRTIAVRALAFRTSKLLRHVYKFCGHQAANSGKSGETLLLQERPHIKSRSFLTDDFKM